MSFLVNNFEMFTESDKHYSFYKDKNSLFFRGKTAFYAPKSNIYAHYSLLLFKQIFYFNLLVRLQIFTNVY